MSRPSLRALALLHIFALSALVPLFAEPAEFSVSLSVGGIKISESGKVSSASVKIHNVLLPRKVERSMSYSSHSPGYLHLERNMTTDAYSVRIALDLSGDFSVEGNASLGPSTYYSFYGVEVSGDLQRAAEVATGPEYLGDWLVASGDVSSNLTLVVNMPLSYSLTYPPDKTYMGVVLKASGPIGIHSSTVSDSLDLREWYQAEAHSSAEVKVLGHTPSKQLHFSFDLHREELKGSLIALDINGNINWVEDEVYCWWLVEASFPDSVEATVTVPEKLVNLTVSSEGGLSLRGAAFLGLDSRIMSEVSADGTASLVARAWTKGVGGAEVKASSVDGSLSERVEAEAKSTVGPKLEYVGYDLYYGYFGDCWVDGKPILFKEIDYYEASVIRHEAVIAKQEGTLEGASVSASTRTWTATSANVTGLAVEGGSTLLVHMRSHIYPNITVPGYTSPVEYYSYASTVLMHSSDTLIRLLGKSDSPALEYEGLPRPYTWDIEVSPTRSVTFPYYKGPETDDTGWLSEHFRIDQVPWGIGMVYGADTSVGSVESIGDRPWTSLTKTGGAPSLTWRL